MKTIVLVNVDWIEYVWHSKKDKKCVFFLLLFSLPLL
jgi:hypothetical protein